MSFPVISRSTAMQRRILALMVCACLVCGWWISGAQAQENEAEPAPQAAAIPAVPKPLDRGDNAWVLTSSALVLMMTAPGLAMFYGGLVRKKNVLSVIMQCISLMAVMTIIWAVYGYSLSFGGGEAW